MAKLPDIQINRVSGPSNAPGPAQAVFQARQIQQGADILARGLTAINNETREFNVTRAKVRAGNEVTRAQERIAGKEFFTPEEIRAMGMDDVVQIDEGETFIPAERVVPEYMSRVMDDAIDTHSEGIKNERDLENWRTEMGYAKDDTMLKINTSAAEQAMKREHLSQEIEIATAVNEGNFAGAEELIKVRYKDPALRAQKLQDNRVSAEKWTLNKQLMSEDPDEIDTLVSYLTSDKFASTTELNQKDQMTYFSAALNRRKAMNTQEKLMEGQRQDFASMEALTNITTGAWTQQDIINNRHSFGRTNYQYLLAQAESEAEGKTRFVTDSITQSNFEVSVMRLETGSYTGDNTFDEEVDMLEQWVMDNASKVDPQTGAVELVISGGDVTKWRERLSDLRASPFAAGTEFKAVADELSVRIRGGTEGDITGLTNVSVETANLYQEAYNSLRTYVQENGGPKADVRKWRKENMPYYLGETSRLSFMRLPLSVRGAAVQTDEGKVIKSETMEDLQRDLSRATTKRDKDSARRNIALFDQWATGPGVNYVVN